LYKKGLWQLKRLKIIFVDLLLIVIDVPLFLVNIPKVDLSVPVNGYQFKTG